MADTEDLKSSCDGEVGCGKGIVMPGDVRHRYSAAVKGQVEFRRRQVPCGPVLSRKGCVEPGPARRCLVKFWHGLA